MSDAKQRFRWFNVSSPVMRPWRQYVRLWNCFNRHTATGEHYWGFGVLQFNKRHLFYVGFEGVSILFIGESSK